MRPCCSTSRAEPPSQWPLRGPIKPFVKICSCVCGCCRTSEESKPHGSVEHLSAAALCSHCRGGGPHCPPYEPSALLGPDLGLFLHSEPERCMMSIPSCWLMPCAHPAAISPSPFHPHGIETAAPSKAATWWAAEGSPGLTVCARMCPFSPAPWDIRVSSHPHVAQPCPLAVVHPCHTPMLVQACPCILPRQTHNDHQLLQELLLYPHASRDPFPGSCTHSAPHTDCTLLQYMLLLEPVPRAPVKGDVMRRGFNTSILPIS